MGIGGSGQPVNLNDAEAAAARQHAVDQSNRAQRAARAADGATEGAAYAEHVRARDAAFEAELPEYLRPRTTA